jgi:S-DNA-T family DNA segregation ATPase FtsK/SpoIIIE
LTTKKEIKRQDDQRREILGILIIAFAVLVFLGLISYHPSDYPNSGSPDFVKNWLGLAGAWISHYLYVYSIGYACLIFPLLIFLFGWDLFFQKEFKYFFRLCLYLLGIGLFLSISLAMPEAVSEEGSKYGYRLSGLLGGFLAEQLNHYLGTVGSIIVLLTALLLLLISATAWSMRETVVAFRTELADLFQLFDKKRKSIFNKNRPRMRKEGTIPIRQVEVSQSDGKKGEHSLKNDVLIKPCISPKSSEIRIDKPKDSSVKEVSHVGSHTTPEGFQFPSLEILIESAGKGKVLDQEGLEKKAHFLEEKLKEFDIRGSVVGIEPGPVITRFEIRPAPGVKVSRFVGAQDDLALVMRAQRVRVVAPIPGKAAVGIEIPNEEPALVTLRSILESNVFHKSTSKLTIALGKTIDGNPYIADLAQMPHLLVAGATGSGKSVCLNAIIISILYRARPSEVKFILIDPKKLELSLYRKLRNHHLMTCEGLNEDVITTVDNAVAVLRSIEVEMEKRYKLLAHAGVRNIDDYNRALKEGRVQTSDEENNHRPLAYIILVVDELADLMLSGARDIEEPISRLAQMSRAVGIHLILATQRPSVDVITGVIKANFPSRIAFQVASKADSRTILDRNGAEKLLGRGDMLFLHPREHEPIRIHGAYVSTEEVQQIVAHIHGQPRGKPWRLPEYGSKKITSGAMRGERDELFHEAAKLVVRHQQGSASLLQRRLRIGYARAGRLIDELEEAGIIGPFDGSKAREVIVDEEGLEVLLHSD